MKVCSRGNREQDASEGGSRVSPSRSETPCWTCRRRRVQCDGALPTCLKCQKAGKECLGYKKPLVWNKGVASRGKMMGKTFQAPPPSPATTVPEVTSSSDNKSDNESETSFDFSSPSLPLETPWQQTDNWEDPNGTAVAMVPRVKSTISNMLLDPIFQDLKPITRYYLDYFCKKLCPEAVLHDIPGHNPFKALIATVGYSPLLLKSMLAAAGRHAANYASSPKTLLKTTTTALSEPGGKLQLSSSSARYHAYWYKQVALTQLRKDLEKSTGSALENDVLVASISLLVWVDLLEAGKNTWRIHLEGMKKIIGLDESQHPLSAQSPSNSISSLSITAHPYFFDICIIFDIMGTTLSRPYKINKPLQPSVTVKQSLFRAEKISFLGCPAELLHLILIINWKCWARNQSSASAVNLNASSPASTHFTDGEVFNEDVEEELTNESILARILHFDATTWAYKTTLYAPESDTQERIHVAVSYQYAILIYYNRVLDPFIAQNTVTLLNDMDKPTTLLHLAHRTLTHLAQIPADHPFVKTILWPAFIAGAELCSPGAATPSSNASQLMTDPIMFSSLPTPPVTSQVIADYRELTRKLLYTFWNMYHSANVINAIDVLEKIWEKTDSILQSMTTEEYEELERSGVWSRGVLNCAEVDNLNGGNGDKKPMQGWKDFWVDGDVDWLFV